MEKRILVVDYRQKGFYRYAVGICRHLKQMDSEMRIIGCYIQRTDEKVIPEAFDELICAQDYRLKPQVILEKYKPIAILVFAHRFFDYMFTIAAHRKNIPVFNFQHGLYQANTTISSFSMRKLPNMIKRQHEKLWIYVRCLYNLSMGNIKTFIHFLVLFFKRKSIYEILNKQFGGEANADVSFIYGKYWELYYQKQYLEMNTKFEIVGYPELEDSQTPIDCSLFADQEKKTICYLAQTAVEDATLKKEEMLSFLKRMEKLAESYNIVIKLHPRSDMRLYENLLDKKYNNIVSVWSDKSFPIADGYIGHESTIIARAMTLTSKVMIVRLRDGRRSPFEEYTKNVCELKDNLSDKINAMMHSREIEINSAFNDFVFYNKNGALKQTAKYIYEHIN